MSVDVKENLQIFRRIAAYSKGIPQDEVYRYGRDYGNLPTPSRSPGRKDWEPVEITLPDGRLAQWWASGLYVIDGGGWFAIQRKAGRTYVYRVNDPYSDHFSERSPAWDLEL